MRLSIIVGVSRWTTDPETDGTVINCAHALLEYSLVNTCVWNKYAVHIVLSRQAFWENTYITIVFIYVVLDYSYSQVKDKLYTHLIYRVVHVVIMCT